MTSSRIKKSAFFAHHNTKQENIDNCLYIWSLFEKMSAHKESYDDNNVSVTDRYYVRGKEVVKPPTYVRYYVNGTMYATFEEFARARREFLGEEE